MEHIDNSEIMLIESESRKGEYYSVNVELLTCSCPFFLIKLSELSIKDPHRLCKHLVKALTIKGIPEHLKQFSDDIYLFAKHNSAFTNKENLSKKEKKWDKSLSLPDNHVITIKSTKKKKYHYLEGIADGKKIIATIPLAGGIVSFKISNFYGSYDLNTQESNMPWNYRYMEQAVINWIVDEYNNVKNIDAPIAIKKIITYKLNPDPIVEGSIKTISVEKIKKTEDFIELPDGNLIMIDQQDEYYHIVGSVESYKIEVFFSINGRHIFYSINGSKTYLLNVVNLLDSTEKKSLEISIEQPQQLILNETKNNFPRNFSFMEKAVKQWIKDEYDKIKY